MAKNKEEKALYAREWRKKNKDRTYVYSLKLRKKKRDFLISIKDNPCTDCKNKFHFSIMQWDHLPGRERSLSIIRNGTIKQIQEEIKNCELVCANCHAIRTWKRQQEKLQKKRQEVLKLDKEIGHKKKREYITGE